VWYLCPKINKKYEKYFKNGEEFKKNCFLYAKFSEVDIKENVKWFDHLRQSVSI